MAHRADFPSHPRHTGRTLPRTGRGAEGVEGKQQVDFIGDYAELHCLSNFTFLRGASRPEELVACACPGLPGTGTHRWCSVSAGVLRAPEQRNSACR